MKVQQTFTEENGTIKTKKETDKTNNPLEKENDELKLKENEAVIHCLSYEKHHELEVNNIKERRLSLSELNKSSDKDIEKIAFNFDNKKSEYSEKTICFENNEYNEKNEKDREKLNEISDPKNYGFKIGISILATAVLIGIIIGILYSTQVISFHVNQTSQTNNTAVNTSFTTAEAESIVIGSYWRLSNKTVVYADKGGIGNFQPNTIEDISENFDRGGIHTFEIDIQALKTGEIIVFHDANTFEATGHDLNFESMSLSEFQAADLRYVNYYDGHMYSSNPKVPLLTDFLKTLCTLDADNSLVFDIKIPQMNSLYAKSLIDTKLIHPHAAVMQSTSLW